MNAWVWLFSIPVLVGLAISPVKAVNIGDFSPLRVGNTWKYHGLEASFYSRGLFCTDQDSIIRLVVVDSMEHHGDSSLFIVSIRDSLFSRAKNILCGTLLLSDTVRTSSYSVWETGSGDIKGGSIFFSQHEIPVDSMTGKINFGGQLKWVHQRYDSSTNWEGSRSINSLTRLQDVGLVDYRNFVLMHGSAGWNRTFRLLEFNGIKLGDFLIVHLTRKPYNARKPEVFSFSPFEVILRTKRNAQGRRIPLLILKR